MAVSYSGRKARVNCVVSENKFSLKVGRWMLEGFLWSSVNLEERSPVSKLF